MKSESGSTSTKVNLRDGETHFLVPIHILSHKSIMRNRNIEILIVIFILSSVILSTTDFSNLNPLNIVTIIFLIIAIIFFILNNRKEK